jgi:hypothetical protein
MVACTAKPISIGLQPSGKSWRHQRPHSPVNRPRKRSDGRLHVRRLPERSRWPAKPHVREDHGDLSPADQHDRKRSFRAFTLDGVDFFIFEQRRRQVTEFRVVLDDQYGAMFLVLAP